jgi:hypothetical protein
VSTVLARRAGFQPRGIQRRANRQEAAGACGLPRRTNACSCQSRRVCRFGLIDAENAESLGEVAFARPDFREGDVIPQGAGRSLRVIQVLEPEREDRLPVLVVELAG